MVALALFSARDTAQLRAQRRKSSVDEQSIEYRRILVGLVELDALVVEIGHIKDWEEYLHEWHRVAYRHLSVVL